MSAFLRLQLRRSIYTVTKRPFTMDTKSPGLLETSTSMREKLVSLLQPTSLAISNDSWQHRHHAPMREQGGGNGETHFSIQVVSNVFKGKNTMQRHRMIYNALSEEFKQGLHALSLHAKTEEEIQAKDV